MESGQNLPAGWASTTGDVHGSQTYLCIEPSDIELCKPIGEGSFGVVYSAKWSCMRGGIRATIEVAVKQMKHPNQEAMDDFRQELSIMSKLFHKNITSLLGACTSEDGTFRMVTELCKKGNLFNVLHTQRRKLKVSWVFKLASQIVSGMEYLHQRRIIHRDLKSLNLLLDDTWQIKITDFGLSRIRSAEGRSVMTGQVGTCQWMAPELIRGQKYSEKVDIYSFAMVLYEMVANQVPFRGLSNVQVAHTVCNAGTRPALPPNVNPKLQQLIIRSWAADPKYRPSFSEVLRLIEEGQAGPSAQLHNEQGPQRPQQPPQEQTAAHPPQGAQAAQPGMEDNWPPCSQPQAQPQQQTHERVAEPAPVAAPSHPVAAPSHPVAAPSHPVAAPSQAETAAEAPCSPLPDHPQQPSAPCPSGPQQGSTGRPPTPSAATYLRLSPVPNRQTNSTQASAAGPPPQPQGRASPPRAAAGQANQMNGYELRRQMARDHSREYDTAAAPTYDFDIFAPPPDYQSSGFFGQSQGAAEPPGRPDAEARPEVAEASSEGEAGQQDSSADARPGTPEELPYICPICNAELPLGTTNQQINAHVDDCLLANFSGSSSGGQRHSSEETFARLERMQSNESLEVPPPELEEIFAEAEAVPPAPHAAPAAPMAVPLVAANNPNDEQHLPVIPSAPPASFDHHARLPGDLRAAEGRWAPPESCWSCGQPLSTQLFDTRRSYVICYSCGTLSTHCRQRYSAHFLLDVMDECPRR